MFGWIVVLIGLNGQVTRADPMFDQIFPTHSACIEAIAKDDRSHKLTACAAYSGER